MYNEPKMKLRSWLLLVAWCATPLAAADISDPVGGYLDRLAHQMLEARSTEVAHLATRAQVVERQRYVRERILRALGGWPERTPLNARITGSFRRDGYIVERLVYESLPRFYVTADVYVPTSAKPPFPALLGTAGHSANGKANSTYQRGWISLARRGVLVLAYDPPGQGERSLYFDPELGQSRVGIGTREHTLSGLQCLLTGTNFARYELWDGIRGIDYLLTRPDVDPQRLAVAGNSGGGTQSAYLAAVEPRLAAAAPSCFITSWSKLWSNPGPQDAEQVFVDFLKDKLDFADFLLSFAPRPLKMLTATRDFFPIEGARATYREAQRFYELLGAPERLGFFEFDDEHGWSAPRRQATYQWMERWLNHREDTGTEQPTETEDERTLWATPNGQVAVAYRCETVQSLNQALAEKIYPERTAAHLRDAARLRALVVARIRLDLDPGAARQAPEVARVPASDQENHPQEALRIETEPGVEVGATLFIPNHAGGRKPVIVYLTPRRARPERDEDLDEMLRAGYLVLVPEPRGWSYGVEVGTGSGYSPTYQASMRALLVGKTMVGLQVHDVIRAVDHLTTRSDVDPARLYLFGKGTGGVVALYTAALDARIARVAAENSVLSYMTIARAKLHQGTTGIIVPGVLKDFDLPDLAVLIAPRALRLVEPVSATGARLPLADARAAYPTAQVAARGEGWSFVRTYGDWLR
jgi:cephalosporin-C deacetylase-like acetyl esterase